MIGVNYQTFKSNISSKGLQPQLIESDSAYDVMAFDGPYHFACHILKNTDDALDFETHMKSTCNQRLEPKKDQDGAQVINPKFAGEGRGYNSLHFELWIGCPGYLYCQDVNGNQRNYINMKCYDAAGTVVAAPATLLATPVGTQAVRTELSLMPQFDYDIQGFCLYQTARPTTTIRAWAFALPDIPTSWGGNKEVIGGLNLGMAPYDKNFMDYVGDSATTIEYNPNMPPANELRMIFRHDVNTVHKLMGEIFWYV